MKSSELNLDLALKSLEMESISFPLAEQITRGLGRTNTIARTENGLPISVEGELVAAQMRHNAGNHIIKKCMEVEEVKNNG